MSENNSPVLPKLVPAANHQVLFNMGEPKILTYTWDNNHVRMPCSDDSQILKKPVNLIRWHQVKYALRNINGIFELKEAILKYNEHHRTVWDFKCLEAYFLESRFAENRENFFTQTLPKMIDLALSLKGLISESIRFLHKNMAQKITMSQKQAACLLANAFFCTFPFRNQEKRKGSSYPSINFSSLFNSPMTDTKFEKLKFIIHYFERVTENRPLGSITYSREVLKLPPNWENSKEKFTRLYTAAEGTIEDTGVGMLQIDFANKFVGGGVLGNGAVQEEIRFLICPEMIISRLFTEVLNADEVLIMTGCERFSDYQGYASSLKWVGDHQDPAGRDSWNRKFTEVAAMDAIFVPKNKHESQYLSWSLKRELNKAYCAFHRHDDSKGDLSAVCTGHWGCGAFGGDKELKAILQLMSASHAKRDVCYFTFGDVQFSKELHRIHSTFQEYDYKVGDVMKFIDEYKDENNGASLFEYLASCC